MNFNAKAQRRKEAEFDSALRPLRLRVIALKAGL
jgi:hypothetical protein